MLGATVFSRASDQGHEPGSQPAGASRSDTNAPALVAASALCESNRVCVNFSEPVAGSAGSGALDPKNYSISGGGSAGVISNLSFGGSGQIVCFSVNSAIAPGVTYTLTVNNVTDLSSNSIPRDAQITFVCSNDPCPITCPTNKTVQCGTAWSFDAPATPCADLVIREMTTTTNGTCPMEITRTWGIQNAEGSFSEVCKQVVTVVDTIPPVVMGCHDIVTNSLASTNGNFVTFSVTATDNCPGPVAVSCSPPSGSFFPIGTNLVNCVARDACGNTNHCQFQVIVLPRQKKGCLQISQDIIHCPTNGVYSWTFSFTNLFPGPLQYLAFVDLPPGVSMSPNPYVLPSVVPSGQGATVTVSITFTGAPLTNFCFRISAHDRTFHECCVIEHCVRLPSCCGKITNDCVVCSTNDHGGWVYTFNYQNLSGQPVQYLYLAATPPTVTVAPITFSPPLPNGAVTNISVNIMPSNPTNCPAKVCFLVSAHTATFEECCVFEHCIELPPCCEPRTYTLDKDFDEGFAVNLNHTNVHDQLQINTQTSPFPYVWVAASTRGTAVKIEASTGKILAEYLSAPQGRLRNPSRTTVDKFGNCWIGNRDENPSGKGSVTRYAIIIGGIRGDKIPSGSGFVFSPNPNGQYLQPPFVYNSGAVDRDGDGLIKTSRGLGDVLQWTNSALADDNGGVSTAEDECVITYIRTAGRGARSLAVDANNDLWVGGIGNRAHEKYTGATGPLQTGDPTLSPPAVPGTLFNIGIGGYGAVIDVNGIVWSSQGPYTGGGLLRLNPSTLTGLNLGVAAGNYGLAVDPCFGSVWHTMLTDGSIATNGAPGRVYVRNSAGTVVGAFGHGSANAQGVCIDQNGNVFVAHSLLGNSTTVGHLRTNGFFVGNVPLVWGSTNGISPTGVAVDSAGKIWVSCFASHNVLRIDPNSLANGMSGGFPVGAVDLAVDLNAFAYTPPPALNVPASPYNYSDQTGFVILGVTSPGGWWTVVRDGCMNGIDWGTVSWNAIVPPGAGIKVEVRADDNSLALPGKPWTQVSNGKHFCGTGIKGRYIEIRVFLSKATGCSESPALLDLTVDCCEKTSCEPAHPNELPQVLKCPGPFLFPKSNAPVTVTMSITVNDPDGDPLTVTWREGANPPYQTDNVPAGAPGATTATLNFTYTFAPGNHVIIIAIDDGHGRRDYCDVIVRVGNGKPVIAPQAGASVVAFSGVIPNFIAEPIATDDDTPPEQIVLSQSPRAGLTVGQGVHLVELTARDLEGNTATGQTFFAVQPIVTLTAPAKYASFTAPATVSASAALAANAGGVASVRLLSNGSVVGVDQEAPYTFVITNVPAGNYVLVAQAVGPDDLLSTSEGVAISVKNEGAVAAAPISRVTLSEGNINFSVQTSPGARIHIESTPTLTSPNWTVLRTINGDGTVMTVTDSISPAARGGGKFYRARSE